MADKEVRLIDANKLKQVLEVLCKDERNPLNITAIAYFALCELVDTMPTIEPDNGWISVKDEMPENDGLYIVCKTVRGHRISFEAHWKENKWLSVVKNNQLDYVTHWQYLPEPPKGE